MPAVGTVVAEDFRATGAPHALGVEVANVGEDAVARWLGVCGGCDPSLAVGHEVRLGLESKGSTPKRGDVMLVLSSELSDAFNFSGG